MIQRKKVTMIELFYDLIYVLAIQKVTGLIHHLHHGELSLNAYLTFVMYSIAILLMWFNQTIYLNKYGNERHFDIIGMMLHMLGAIYISNIINLESSVSFFLFNLTIVYMMSIIVIQYYLHSKSSGKMPEDIRRQLYVLFIGIFLIILALLLGSTYGIPVAILGYLSTMFLPALFKRKINVTGINFPHLVERVSLITILVFGEMVITVATGFAQHGIDLDVILTFVMMVLFFGTYAIQIEKLTNTQQQTKGFTMIYSHIGIFIGLSMVTASFSFLEQSVHMPFLFLFRWSGLIMTYCCFIFIAKYNKTTCLFTRKERIYCIGALCLGMLIAWFNQTHILIFHTGMLVTVFLIFIIFFKKIPKQIQK